MIDFACTNCGKQFRVSDDAAGRRGTCAKCGASMVVPHLVTQLSVPSVLPIEQPAVPQIKTKQPRLRKHRYSHVDQLTIAAASAVGLGLLLLTVMPFCKWVNFGAGGMTGIQGDGKIILGVTVVVGAVFVASMLLQKYIMPASLLAGAWGVVVACWMVRLVVRIGDVLSSPDIEGNPFASMFASHVSPGIGLYMGLIGGLIIAVACSVLAYQQLYRTNSLAFFYASQSCILLLGVLVLVSGEIATKWREGAYSNGRASEAAKAASEIAETMMDDLPIETPTKKPKEPDWTAKIYGDEFERTNSYGEKQAEHELTLKLMVRLPEGKILKQVKGELVLAMPDGKVCWAGPIVLENDVSFKHLVCHWLAIKYNDDDAKHRFMRHYTSKITATFTPTYMRLADGTETTNFK